MDTIPDLIPDDIAVPDDLPAQQRAFLVSIYTAADDAERDTARLVYADWLDERGDPAAGEQRLAVALRAVLAAPGDDAPRLAYAAVCEQYGDRERAEFIRVQCRTAQPRICRVAPTPCERCADCRQHHHAMLLARELLKAQHFWDWFGDTVSQRWTGSPAVSIRWSDMMCEVGQFNGDDNERWQLFVRRGFVDRLVCSWDDCRDRLDAIRRAQPVTRVRLTNWPELEPVGLTWGITRVRLRGRKQDRVINHGIEDLANLMPAVDNMLHRDAVLGCLKAEWPGVEFDLPGAFVGLDAQGNTVNLTGVTP